MGEAFTFKGRVAVVTGAAQGIGFHSEKKIMREWNEGGVCGI